MANYDTQVPQMTDAQYSYSGPGCSAAGHKGVQNGDSHLDILPPELLSYIFIAGEQAERFVATRQSSLHVRFQELVSQVCSRWRVVAINNPDLWSWITIKRPSHREMTALYLVRAGSTVSLDIEIEMRSGFWDQAEISPTDWATQLGYTLDEFEFLKSHGASPGRWRTLSIWARQPEPLLEAMAFLHGQAAPMLQCLSLKWASSSIQQFEESRALNGVDISSRSFTLSDSSAPNLRHVELISVPWPFVLNHPSPLFTGLRSLSLTAATRLYSSTKLIALLRSNPYLESLHLSSGPNDLDSVYVSEYPSSSICLPSLRSLSLQSTYNSDWILNVLMTIQTPNLEMFKLATELYTDYPVSTTNSELRLLNYLSGREPNGDEHMNRSTSDVELKSIYPSLRELDVSQVACPSGGKTMMALLTSFALVSRLSIAGHQIDCLGRFPWILPKLQFLVLNGYPYPELGNILQRRAAAGHPVLMVELRGSHSWDQETRAAYIDTLPTDVTATDYFEPESVMGDDESVLEDWEDEVDDEDAGGYSDVEDEWMEGAELNLNDDGVEYEDHEEYNEDGEGEEEYGASDGYDEAEEYSEDVYVPACWNDEYNIASQAYGLEGLDFDGWSYNDLNPFIGELYPDEEADVEGGDGGDDGGDEWGGYDVDDSDGDGGEDLEGGGSEHGDDSYSDNYDFDDGYDYEDD